MILDLVLHGLRAQPNPPLSREIFEENLLYESALLSTLHLIIPSTFALLIDLRIGMNSYSENTGLLVFRRLKDVRLVGSEIGLSLNDGHQKVWSIGNAQFLFDHSHIEASVPDLFVDRRIEVVAKQVEFYAGNVNELGETWATIETDPDGVPIADGFVQSIPNWCSQFALSGIAKRETS